MGALYGDVSDLYDVRLKYFSTVLISYKTFSATR